MSSMSGSQDGYSSSEPAESWDSELEDMPLCQPSSPKARPANIPRLPIASMLQTAGAPRPAIPSLSRGFEGLSALPRSDADWEPLPTSRGHPSQRTSRQREEPGPAPAPAISLPDTKHMTGNLSSRVPAPGLQPAAQIGPKQLLHVNLMCLAFNLLDSPPAQQGASCISAGAQRMITQQCVQRFGVSANQVELFSMTSLREQQGPGQAQGKHWGVHINPAPFTLKTVEQLMSERQAATEHRVENARTIDTMYTDIKALQSDKEAAQAKNSQLEAQLAQLRKQLQKSEEDKGKLRQLIHTLRESFEDVILKQQAQPLPVSRDLVKKARKSKASRHTAPPPAAAAPPPGAPATSRPAGVNQVSCSLAAPAVAASVPLRSDAAGTPTQTPAAAPSTHAPHEAEPHSPRSSSPPCADLLALPAPGPDTSTASPAPRVHLPLIPKLSLGNSKQMPVQVRAGQQQGQGLSRAESPEQPGILRQSCVPTPDTLEAPPSTRSSRRPEGAPHTMGTPLELSFRRMEGPEQDCGSCSSSSGSEASSSPSHHRHTPTSSQGVQPGLLSFLPAAGPTDDAPLTHRGSTPSPAGLLKETATSSPLDSFSTTKTLPLVPRLNLLGAAAAATSAAIDAPPLSSRGR